MKRSARIVIVIVTTVFGLFAVWFIVSGIVQTATAPAPRLTAAEEQAIVQARGQAFVDEQGKKLLAGEWQVLAVRRSQRIREIVVASRDGAREVLEVERCYNRPDFATVVRGDRVAFSLVLVEPPFGKGMRTPVCWISPRRL